MNNYKLTVGLEIHVQLKTATKMFCGCKNDPFNSKPNTNVCPVCYGLPGALPLLNKEAVKKTVELGQALNGSITSPTFWARKNYFYPDLPKGYQISQSTAPLVKNATLTIYGVDHHIQRIHLEEDAGKLIHEQGKNFSLVNYNRAGVPLIEMVTEPYFHSAESAKRFCQELQRVMRSLELSDADMEKGQMRCEANISISKTDSLGTKVEVKNINSFRSVEKAIMYELDRQMEALEAGEKIVQETRTWNDAAGKTVSMRSKETSADYRYFPEPDLPVVEIVGGEVKTHKLPEDRRKDLEKIGITAEVSRILVDRKLDQEVLIIQGREPKFTKDVANLMLEFAQFISLNSEDKIALLQAKSNSGWTKDTLAEVLEKISEGMPTEQVIASFSSDLDLSPVIDEVIKSNQAAVSDFKSGKEQAFHFLVGQVMAKTKGKANIQTVREELKKALS